jgi:hypothetical protein
MTALQTYDFFTVHFLLHEMMIGQRGPNSYIQVQMENFQYRLYKNIKDKISMVLQGTLNCSMVLVPCSMVGVK